MSPAERKRQVLSLLERLREVLQKEAAGLSKEEVQVAETAGEAGRLLQELKQALEEEPSLKQDSEVQPRLQEVHRLRKENLELARRKKEDLLEKLNHVRRGKKAVRAYGSSQAGGGRGEKFVWKKS